MPKIGFLAFCGAVALAITTAAQAQTYPSQAVRIIVPFSAGGISDSVARIISGKLKELWKQDVIIENRPGPPGTMSAAKSAPDGYTLMLTSNGHTVANVINKSNQFDPVKDFSGITRIASVPLVMIVPPDFPAKTIGDFVALARKNPGKFNFSTGGIASTSYLAAEIFRQATQLSLVHVPYKGAPESITAIMRGDSHLSFATLPTAKELLEGGKAQILAVNTARRLAQLPDVPTIAEAGVPDYKYDSWFGLMAPANTPKPILVKVSQDVAKVLQMPDVHDAFLALGAIPNADTPDEFDVVIRNDTETNLKILRNANVGGDR